MGCFREVLGVLSVAAASITFGQTPPAWPGIQVTKVAGGFNAITDIVNAGDGSGRLFVVEQQGRIRVVRNGSTLPTPFLDISSNVSCCGERGLLGLAFPPGYAGKGYFYVYYTAGTFDITVSRFRVTADPDVADPASEAVLLTVPHREFSNHNGGQLAFGKDGYLYIGTGDGGGAGDALANGQNPGSLLAKVLRIDVESGAAPYSVPPSNPFAGSPGYRPEIWAWGLRNPWRFSFDRSNADLYIADVGQNGYEEVNYQPAASAGGENYGWSIMEGQHCFNAAGCTTNGLTLPVAEYDHSGDDCSITGGFVYRGAGYPALQGVYLYGDYCSGRIWGLRQTGGAWQRTELLKTTLSISTFGEDEAGEIYIGDRTNNEIYSISPGAPNTGVLAVVNAASYGPGLTPGSIASLFAAGLGLPAGIQGAAGVPLPQVIGGTSVTVNGIPAPLYAVANVNGAEQINFQVPNELAGATTATVAVTMNGVAKGQRDIAVGSAYPELFTTDGVHAATIQTEGVLVLFGTGFGPVSNPPATGAAAPISPLSTTSTTPQVWIGGQPATVLFSGLAPMFAGLCQLNVQIPAGLPPGDADVVVAFGDRSSRVVKATLQ